MCPLVIQGVERICLIPLFEQFYFYYRTLFIKLKEMLVTTYFDDTPRLPLSNDQASTPYNFLYKKSNYIILEETMPA